MQSELEMLRLKQDSTKRELKNTRERMEELKQNLAFNRDKACYLAEKLDTINRKVKELEDSEYSGLKREK